MAKKQLKRIDSDRRFVVISLEKKRWVVSAIWSDVRVFRAADELRKEADKYGDLGARFEVVYEDEYFSGKPFSFLRAPANIKQLLEELDKQKEKKPKVVGRLAVTTVAKDAAPVESDFDKWMKGGG